MRVLAAMSGGVDSSVAAARMVAAGHEVVGVHLALSQAPGTLRSGSRGCCSREDAGDARRVADILGNPLLRLGFRRPVQSGRDRRLRRLLRPGETPNPCVRCNERIKFSALAARAVALGFDAVATGHYARLSGVGCARAVDRDKDQSYVLGVLTAEQLGRAVFPIGDTPKAAIREEAARLGLAVAESPTATTSASSPPVTPGLPGRANRVRPGAVVDADGAVLARHDGVHGFTIGQRKGLGIPGRVRTGGRATSPVSTPGPARCGWAPPPTSTWVTDRAAAGVHRRCGAGRSDRVRCSVRAHGGVARPCRTGRRRAAGEIARAVARVAAGQTVVLYRPDPAGDEVLASATLAAG